VTDKGITRKVLFVTEDGKTFHDHSKARSHQARQRFHEWCQKNICVGGEWSSEMVANAILEEWIVTKRGVPLRHGEDNKEVSNAID
jgi:hypothetical protein